MANRLTGVLQARVLAPAALLGVLGVIAYLLLPPEPLRDRLAAARPSVYLVVHSRDGREINDGTAWVIGPGTLATAAHQIDIIEQLKKLGFKSFVRANFPPYETHEIVSVATHPNYEAFNLRLQLHAPVVGLQKSYTVFGYDVALLRVAPTARLAAPLKLAAPETLLRLAAGDEVGYIGYPAGRMILGGVNIAAPVPQTLTGTITAVTDFFLAAGEPDERHLIQHSMPAINGASGSPLFNRRGEVIGLFSQANLARIGGELIPIMPINFVQRADLIAELLGGKIDGVVAAREKEWPKRIAALRSGPDSAIEDFQFLTQSRGAKPALDAELALQQAQNPRDREAQIDFAVPGAGSLFVIAVGDYPAPVSLSVRDPDAANKELARKAGDGDHYPHYPYLQMEPDKAAKITVAVAGTSPVGKVRLRIYFVPKKT